MNFTYFLEVTYILKSFKKVIFFVNAMIKSTSIYKNTTWDYFTIYITACV